MPDVDKVIAQAEQNLIIDPNDLDRAWMRQPELYYRVAETYELMSSRKAAQDQALKEAEAAALRRVRKDADIAGEKVTVSECEARVMLDKSVMKERERVFELSEQIGKLRALRDTFAQRKDALKGLTDLWLGGYYQNASRSGSERNVRITRADENKREMARQREARRKDT